MFPLRQISVFAAIGVVAASIPATALATGSAEGVPTKLSIAMDGRMTVTMPDPASQPACATSLRFATDDNSQKSMLIAAKLAGKAVKITGSNDCSVWGDAETIHHLVLG